MSVDPQGELLPQGGGDPIPLIRPSLKIGRRESCDICLRFPNISGQHCELQFQDGYWYLLDLGSTNGTKVNGIRVTKKLLKPGDEIAIASRRFTIEYNMSTERLAIEEIEENAAFSQTLLEKAGLERPRRRQQ